MPMYNKDSVKYYILANDLEFSKCTDIPTPDLENSIFFVYELHNVEHQESLQANVSNLLKVFGDTVGAAEYYEYLKTRGTPRTALHQFILKCCHNQDYWSIPIENITHILSNTHYLDFNMELGQLVELVATTDAQNFYPCFYQRYQCTGCQVFGVHQRKITKIHVDSSTDVKEHVKNRALQCSTVQYAK